MRTLLVEDDEDYLGTMIEALAKAIPGIELVVAQSRDSAFERVSATVFDFVVCDLKIPTQDGALDQDIQHGLAVHGRCRELAPGTPVLILTAFGLLALDHLSSLFAESPPQTFVGNRRPVPMTDFVQKGRFDDFVAKVTEFGAQLADLANVEVLTEPADLALSLGMKQTLRIMASRRDGNQVRVSALGGGLSAAKICRVEVSDAYGATTALAVGKLGTLKVLEVEQRRYERYVLPLLQPASFAARLDEVRIGAGDAGGLFYSLADDFDRSLFDVLAADPLGGAALVPVIQALEGRWLDSAQPRTKAIRDVRTGLVSDEALAPHRADLDAIGCSQFEARNVVVNHCCQHRDLHGLNILVGRDGRPLLIDYGEVGISAASHDPVALELSLLFHPDGRATVGDWPSVVQARKWGQLDEYLAGCPVPDFVRACRKWSSEVSAGPREVCAHAYSYALRQVPYPDTPQPIAAAIVAAAIDAF